MEKQESWLPNFAFAAAVLLGALVLYMGSYFATVHWTEIIVP